MHVCIYIYIYIVAAREPTRTPIFPPVRDVQMSINKQRSIHIYIYIYIVYIYIYIYMLKQLLVNIVSKGGIYSITRLVLLSPTRV